MSFHETSRFSLFEDNTRSTWETPQHLLDYITSSAFPLMPSNAQLVFERPHHREYLDSYLAHSTTPLKCEPNPGNGDFMMLVLE